MGSWTPLEMEMDSNIGGHHWEKPSSHLLLSKHPVQYTFGLSLIAKSCMPQVQISLAILTFDMAIFVKKLQELILKITPNKELSFYLFTFKLKF